MATNIIVDGTAVNYVFALPIELDVCSWEFVGFNICFNGDKLRY
jgi:inosine-uridine nucleoside N-ribohydrolase